MPLLNYTTTVPAQRTIEQIQRLLVKHGAKAIMTEYDNNREITGLAFRVNSAHGELPIRLPVKVEAVEAILYRDWDEGRMERKYTREGHARRVAWRIMKDWLEVQMALIETEMVTMAEVFLSYVQVGEGISVYKALSDRRFQLPPGRSD